MKYKVMTNEMTSLERARQKAREPAKPANPRFRDRLVNHPLPDQFHLLTLSPCVNAAARRADKKTGLDGPKEAFVARAVVVEADCAAGSLRYRDGGPGRCMRRA
jgi:hypothetical protein